MNIEAVDLSTLDFGKAPSTPRPSNVESVDLSDIEPNTHQIEYTPRNDFEKLIHKGLEIATEKRSECITKRKEHFKIYLLW